MQPPVPRRATAARTEAVAEPLTAETKTDKAAPSAGNSAKGKLIFDVPKGTEFTGLELHDSPFSGGVEVGLS